MTSFSYEKLLYIHRENNCKTKLLRTTFLWPEIACLPRVWTLETNFFTKSTACQIMASVESSQYLRTQKLPIIDLENFADLNLLLPLEYTQDKIQVNILIIMVSWVVIVKNFKRKVKEHIVTNKCLLWEKDNILNLLERESVWKKNRNILLD